MRLTVALLMAVAMASSVHQAGGSAQVQVKFAYYVNPTGLRADGKSCDPVGACDPLFTIRVQFPDGFNPRVTTDRASEQNSVSFGDKIVDVDNPLVLTRDVYDGHFTIEVKVDDYDPIGGWDYIGTFFLSHYHVAVPNGGIPVTKEILLRDAGPPQAVLVLQISVACHANYYGTDCAKICIAANDDTSGRYTCDIGGNKVCLPTYHPASGCRETYCALLNPCQNGGRCGNIDTGFVCECVGLWSGASCTQPTSACESGTPCRNNGTCVGGTGSSGCSCRPGYSGSFCSADVNECAPGAPPVCQNGAACSNQFGTYSCHCQPGWTGKNCSEDVNECANESGGAAVNASLPAACYNSGRCVNQPGNFSCVCTAGFRGDRCQQDIDECSEEQPAVVCRAEVEVCQNLQGSFVCLCRPGYRGDNCSVRYEVEPDAVSGGSGAPDGRLLAGALVPSLLLLAGLLAAGGFCLHRRRSAWLRALGKRRDDTNDIGYNNNSGIATTRSSAFTENATYDVAVSSISFPSAASEDPYFEAAAEYAEVRGGYDTLNRRGQPLEFAPPPLPPKRPEEVASPSSQTGPGAAVGPYDMMAEATGGPAEYDNYK